MKEQLENIKNSAAQELSGVNSKEQLEAFRVRFLGKKGLLTDVLKGMGKLSAEERPVIGQIANEVRGFIEGEISALQEKIHREELERKLAAETIDVTMPGKTFESGRPHPLTIVLDQLKNIFLGMGFSVAEGPDVELDYYNFEALNIPPEHLKWYAAFHNEGHHPHVHIMVYSTDPREGFINEYGIEKIRSAMARDIFAQDLQSIYEDQTEIRQKLKKAANKLIREILSRAENSSYENETVEQKLILLAEKLKQTKGKKVYGYLNRNTKDLIDSIVDELAKDKTIAELYDLW